MSSYQTIKMVLTEDVEESLNNEKYSHQIMKNLENDIRTMRRSMAALPTSREMESLPHLKILNNLTTEIANDTNHFFNKSLMKFSVFNEMMVKELFSYVANAVIKTRIYNNKEIIKISDELFMNLIKWGTSQLKTKNVFILEMLNIIINSNAEYYKTNGKESPHYYPFGEKLEATEKHQDWVNNLKKGDRIDCLYSEDNKKCWAPAEVINKDWNSFRVRFLHDNKESFIYNKYFETMPFGSKKNLYEFRNNWKIGDQVDFYSFQDFWKPYKIVDIKNEENGYQENMKIVVIEELEKKSEDETNKYILNVNSPHLNLYGKYSSTTNDFDDNDDEYFLDLVNKFNYAILRNKTPSSNSIYLVKYINIFGENGGFDFIKKIFEEKDISQEILGHAIKLFNSCCINLVKPFIRSYGPQIYESINHYLLVNTKMNLRDLNKNNITTALNSISSLVTRLNYEKEAKKIILNLEIELALICLKSEFLDKQFYGAKLFNSIESKSSEFNNEIGKEELAKILKKENIFEILVKGHHSLISKGNGILKILFSQNEVNEEQLELLWSRICKADFETQNALLDLIKEILYDFSKLEVIFFINKMIEHAEDIVNQELVDLLFSLKKVGWNRYNEVQVVENVNKVLWGILQNNKKEIKKEIIVEILKNFIKYLEEHENSEYIVMIVNNVNNGVNSIRNIKILGKLLEVGNVVTEKTLVAIRTKNLLEKLIKDIEKIIETLIFFEKSDKVNSKNPHLEQLEQDLNRRFKLINKINLKKEGEDFLHFSDIRRIWELVFNANLDNKLTLNWIRNYISQENKESLVEDYQNFFLENIRKFEEKNKDSFFHLFILLFYRINLIRKNFIVKKLKLETMGTLRYNTKTTNLYILNNEIKEFFGFNQIWDLFLKIDDLKLEENIVKFLSILYLKPLFEENVYEIYEKEKINIFEKCKEMVMSGDKNGARKGTNLLEKLIKRQEVKGFYDLKSFYALKQMPNILVSIEKDGGYSKEKFTNSFKLNKTIGNLRKKIALVYKMKFESIEMRVDHSDGLELTQYDNSLTLHQLGFSKKLDLIIKEVELPEIEEELIISENGNHFTEKAYLVFEEIFEFFSTEGKMTRADLARYTTEATEGSFCTVQDDRIIFVFNNYDLEKKDYLTKEQFINFFFETASKNLTKLNTVKQNLQSLGYGKDLKLKKEKKNEILTNFLKTSFRYFLTLDYNFYQKLLFLLENEQNNHFKNFLMFTTPNFNMMINIIENPEQVLKLYFNNNFIWNYFIVLIESAVFDSKSICKILEYNDYDYDEEKKKKLILKVFSNSFIELLIRKIDNLCFDNLEELEEKSTNFNFLEKLLKIGISFIQKDYINDTTNFVSFKIKMKRKNKEKQLKEKLTQENQQNKLKDVGIQKEDSEQRKEVSTNLPTNTSESLRTNEEEKKLLKVKVYLEKDEITLINSLKKLSFENLNKKCLEVLENLLNNEDILINYSSTSLLKSIIVIFLSSLITNPKYLADLLTKEKSSFKKILFNGLTHKQALVKFYFKSFYSYLTANVGDDDLKKTFLNIIIKSIKESTDNDEIHVMIELASNLMTEIQNIKNNLESEIDLQNLFKEFEQKLMNYKTKELDFNSEDNTLISILTFIEKILEFDYSIIKNYSESEKRDFIKFLFKNCLFQVTEKGIDLDSIICKSEKSRAKALSLLRLIAKDDIRAVMYIMLIGYKPLSNQIPDLNYNFKPINNKRNKLNYIGIRNPGCVCYMNAMLQQFYCTPPFRYGLLLADDGEDEYPFIQNDECVLEDDNVFHQLQKMFAYLDISQRSDFSPRDFCMSYKDFTGERVNLMVQQDAQEFLNMIFDKLEKSLKPTPFKGILDSVFAGKTSNVFTCQNCGFVRSNEELFYNLSLEVKNFDNIQDSFKKFIKPEIISDFNCDNCKKKCDITKQAFLKDLPNVLIIHLQKISFDLEALRNVKYSSRYEFDTRLDLKKYVMEKNIGKKKEIPDDEIEIEDKEASIEIEEGLDCEYRLVGVVIHNGNAEYGHYTSLINVNRNDPNREEVKEDVWLEFDDSRISKYNMNNFENDCFGSSNNETEFPALIDVDVTTSKSAYILIYDKIKNSNLKFHFNTDDIKEKEKLLRNLIKKEEYVIKDNIIEIKWNNLNKYIPEKYKQMIEIDNRNLVLENQLFCSNFTNTLTEIISNCGIPNLDIETQFDYESTPYQKSLTDMYLKILPNYFFKIFCISSDNLKIQTFVNIIKSSLIINNQMIGPFFEDYIYQAFNYLCNLLINNTDINTRRATGFFISNALSLMIRKYKFNLYCSFNKEVEDMEDTERYHYFFLQIFENLVNIIPNSQNQSNYKKLDSFFEMMKNLCEANAEILQYLLQKNILHRLYDMFMALENNKLNSHEKSLTNVLSLIALLLNKLKKSISKASNENVKKLKDYYSFFLNAQFVNKIMKEDYRFNRYEALHQIIEIICLNNIVLSREIIYLGLKSILTANDTEAIGYLEGFNTLLCLNDKYFQNRITLILGSPKIIDLKHKHNNKTHFSYGINKENSLKKNKITYLSPFGYEKGLLEQLISEKNSNESLALLLIFYILSFCENSIGVLEYFILLPPFNYIHSSMFDWFRDYVDYQLKLLPNSYNPPNPEFFYLFYNSLPEKLSKFENLVREYLVQKNILSLENSKQFKVFAENNEEIRSIRTQFILGKTNAIKHLNKIILFEDDFGELSINLNLINICLMPLKSDGTKNLNIPQENLSFESYINKADIDGELAEFMGKETMKDNEYDIEEYQKKENSDNEDLLKQKKESEQYSNNYNSNVSSFFKKDYIIRISIKNTTYKNFFVKILISTQKNTEANYETGEFIRFVKNNKKDILFKNLFLYDTEKSFDGLVVFCSTYETEKNCVRFYDDCQCGPFDLVYEWN